MLCCIQNIAKDQFSLFVALMVIPWAQSQWRSCHKNESRDVYILTMVIANMPPQKNPAWIAILLEKHFLSHGPHCDRWLQTSQERKLGTVSGLKPSAIKSRKALEQSWHSLSIRISCFVKLGVFSEHSSGDCEASQTSEKNVAGDKLRFCKHFDGPTKPIVARHHFTCFPPYDFPNLWASLHNSLHGRPS